MLKSPILAVLEMVGHFWSQSLLQWAKLSNGLLETCQKGKGTVPVVCDEEDCVRCVRHIQEQVVARLPLCHVAMLVLCEELVLNLLPATQAACLRSMFLNYLTLWNGKP